MIQCHHQPLPRGTSPSETGTVRLTVRWLGSGEGQWFESDQKTGEGHCRGRWSGRRSHAGGSQEPESLSPYQ